MSDTGARRALTSPDLVVPPPPIIRDDDLLLLLTARWSNGGAHRLRRATVEGVLAAVDPDTARRGARRATAAALRALPHTVVDLVPLARAIPPSVLAPLLPSTAATPATAKMAADGARGHAGTTHDATPATVEEAADGALDHAGAGRDATAAVTAEGEEAWEVAVAGALVQARDATAALVVGSLLGWEESPVRFTRRVAARDTEVAGRAVAAGDEVRVDLAPGDRFGHGPHACPGRVLAEALAAGMLDGLHPHWCPVPEQPIEADPAHPNLRLPKQVLLEHR